MLEVEGPPWELKREEDSAAFDIACFRKFSIVFEADILSGP